MSLNLDKAQIEAMIAHEAETRLERLLAPYPVIRAEWEAVRRLEVEVLDAMTQAMTETVPERARHHAAFVARRFPELVERKMAIKPVIERLHLYDAGPFYR